MAGLWQVLLYPIPCIFVLSLIVFIHEFGHYWVARCFKVDIETFSIGMGRELVGRTDKHGTRWKLGAIPFGGYVRMRGGMLPRKSRGDYNDNGNGRRLIVDSPLGVRIAVVAAGPLVNIIFTALIFSFQYASSGKRFIPPVIDEVWADMPAIKAGIQVGDVVLSINGHHIATWDDISRNILLHPNEPAALCVRRVDKKICLTVNPTVIDIPGATAGMTTHDVRLGIRHFGPVEPVTQTPLEALRDGIGKTAWVIEGEIIAPWQILRGTRPPEKVAGVASVASMAHNTAQNGLMDLVGLSAFLSLNLALINLLPIPMLDGGHLLFYAVEAVTGKPPGEAVVNYGFRFGLALVLTLALFALWNDISGMVHAHLS